MTLSHASSLLTFMASSKTSPDVTAPTSSIPNDPSLVTPPVLKSSHCPLSENLTIFSASISSGLIWLWHLVSVSALEENTHLEGMEDA